MATLRIEINLDNQAFEDPNEVERILDNANLGDLAAEPCEIKLYDSNGNVVGFATISDD